MSIVSIVRETDPEIMVKRALELIGGLDSYVKQGQKIFVKPNVCGGVPEKKGSFTNPKVLASTIRLLHKMGASVSVGEADSCMYAADVMLKETSIGEVAAREGANVVNLSQGDMVKIEVPDGKAVKSFSVNKSVTDADAIIVMPVMKTHACTVVTLGMKAMFGILPEKKKSRYHSKLDQVIVDVNSALPPKLTIIDATTAMEGKGPFEGELVELGLVIAGNNVVSTDACAASVMGIDPVSIDHLRFASEKGLGTINLNEIKVKGESIEAVKRPFIQAKPVKVDRIVSRFSTELCYHGIHAEYEGAVKSWKKAQQKS